MTQLPRTTSFNTVSGIMLFIFFSCNLWAQDPFPDYAPIYQDDIIARVDITLPADSLAIILAPGNEESEYHFHATFMFDNGTIRDTFEDAGFQLRGNTSRYARKKSFQVSLNTYVPGRTWYGVEKINLNGEHNDPTVSRSKICWDLLRDIGVPAPRSSHVELYINDTYYGLYANVEHIDEEFVETRFGNKDGNLYKCLWPADMVYLGEDPNLYKLTSGDRRVYELKTNEEIDDYSDLANLIDILNNTSIANMRCELEAVFNVNSFLKSMAFDILAGNWDGPLYNKNNFFLYHNTATGLFEFMPYDLDNTFGIDWFGIDWSVQPIYNWGHPFEPRPLYWRILEVPEYKIRMSYYLNKILEEVYKESVLFPQIDSLKALLAPSVEDDVFYTLDYGFSIDDFNKGFGETVPYPHVKKAIKPFIATRRSVALQQLQLDDILPIIDNQKSYYHVASNKMIIQAWIEDDQGIDFVDGIFQWNGTGLPEAIGMHDDGQHYDGEADDGLYGLVLHCFDTSAFLTYSIKAYDINGIASSDPVCGKHKLVFGCSAITLAINEFMASNSSTTTDDFGEYEDWVEIYNYGTEPVYLGDYYLSDKSNDPTKWQFPAISIDSGMYLLIWADEDEDQGPLHADIKLSADGEFIGIFDSDLNNNVLIDGLDFGPQVTDIPFGRYPNGTGPFMELYPTPGSANQQITSTSEAQDMIQYTMHPNPMSDVLYVKSNWTPLRHSQIVLLNSFGQVMMEKDCQSTLTFEINHLPMGIYLLGQRHDGEFKMIGKVVKQE